MLKTAILFGVLGTLATSPAMAAKGGYGTPNNVNNNNNNTNNNNANNKPLPQYPPPVDTTPSQEDRKKLDEARKVVAKAQARLNEVVGKLKNDFDAAPEHKAVVVAAQKAQASYDALRDKDLSALHESAAYKSAVAEREQLSVQLASATDDADRPQIAQKRLEAGKKLTAMEVAALDADPGAAEAHQKLVDAGGKYTAQLQEFQQSIRTNPDWQAAKADLDKAKADATAADKELASELAKEADAQKARAAQVAQIDRERLEQSGKGGARMAPGQ